MSAAVRLEAGDCREVLLSIADDSIDSCVTDPPYALVSIVKRFANSPRSERTENTKNPYGRTGRGFMGQRWDTGETAHDPAFWAEVLRVLKPGAHLVAFAGTRTYHRMTCAIEDAGFEVRDMLTWNYGSGFPKSHNVSKSIDRAAGAKRAIVGSGRAGASSLERVRRVERGHRPALTNCTPESFPITAAATDAAREWDGWGTALKPSLEPICLARKPLIGTVAENVLTHGTGALNIDGCRVEGLMDGVWGTSNKTIDPDRMFNGSPEMGEYRTKAHDAGRWPANVVHDGSEEVLAAFAVSGDRGAFAPVRGNEPSAAIDKVYGERARVAGAFHGDNGTAARFFFSAKADSEDRWGSKHPTVKPVDLMRWLARLVTPPGGTLLDPFAGSGTAGVAALAEGFNAVLIEREAEYLADIRERLAFYSGDGRHSLASKNRNAKPSSAAPLLDAMEAPLTDAERRDDSLRSYDAAISAKRREAAE